MANRTYGFYLVHYIRFHKNTTHSEKRYDKSRDPSFETMQ